MRYEVKKCDGYLEVDVWQGFSKIEMFEIFGKLAQLDPKKSLPDLWALHDGAMLPFNEMKSVAETISKGMPPEAKGSKSAIVVSDTFQQAQVELYVAETKSMKLNMQIFLTKEDALDWLLAPACAE